MANSRSKDLEKQLLKSARSNSPSVGNMRDILQEKFKRDTIVTIKNVLNEDFGFIYTDPSEEVVEQPDRATRRVYFGEPKAQVIEKGETVNIVGWKAYLALDKMWKKYAHFENEKTGQAMVGNTKEMEKFLGKAYLGQVDINNFASKTYDDSQSGGTTRKKPGRPPKQETPDDELKFATEGETATNE